MSSGLPVLSPVNGGSAQELSGEGEESDER